MGFTTVKTVEVKAETTTPGELRTITDANGTRIGSSRARRVLPKMEFDIDEDGAIVHGPPRTSSYPFFVSNENGNHTVDFPLMPLQQSVDHFQHPNHLHPLFRSHPFVDEVGFPPHEPLHGSSSEASTSTVTRAAMTSQPRWTTTSANQVMTEDDLMELDENVHDDGDRELKAVAAALGSRMDGSAPSASTAAGSSESAGNGNNSSGSSGVSRMKERVLNDTRASSLVVKFDKTIEKFVCGSSIERFSGHTGVCRVLGSKKYPITPHSLHLGDLIRIGSVGLVVREINRTDSESTAEALSDHELQQLREQYLSLPLQQPTTGMSTTAEDEVDPEAEAQPNEDNDNTHHDHHSCGSSEEEEQDNQGSHNKRHRRHVGNETSDEERECDDHDHCCCGSHDEDEVHDGSDCCCDKPMNTTSTSNRRVCYICYDGDEEPAENPLVAPCNCKGDTKYVHLNCLQRWNNNLDVDGSNPNLKVCAVTNTDGLDVCTICKATYLTKVRLDDGRTISLLAKKLPPPYVTFAVVTQHETRNRSTALTNTQFQLSFANLPKNLSCLTIGRSTSNNMTLRYRTVSQLHAKIRYQDKQFFITDAASSNGTMLFLNRPLELDWNKAVFVKIGRTILTLRAKRRWHWSPLSNDDKDKDKDSLTFPFSVYPPFPLTSDHTEVHGTTSGESRTLLNDPTAEILPFRARLHPQYVAQPHRISDGTLGPNRVFMTRRLSSFEPSYATYLSTSHRSVDTGAVHATTRLVRVPSAPPLSSPSTHDMTSVAPSGSGSNPFSQRVAATRSPSPRRATVPMDASMASLTSQLASELRMEQ